jgi:hypothetical protein
VSIYFDITEAVQMQALAVEAAELLIKAIDNDSQLSGTVDDAKVTDVTPFTETRQTPAAGGLRMHGRDPQASRIRIRRRNG